MRPIAPLLTALTLTALTAPAHASGFNCPVTPLAPDCEPLIDTAPITADTLFHIQCDGSALTPEGPETYTLDPTADALMLDSEDFAFEVDARFVATDACGDGPIFAIDGCLPAGRYVIAHVDDGGYQPAFAVDAPTCPDADASADADDSAGCQQSPAPGAAWLGLLLLALRRRARPLDRPAR